MNTANEWIAAVVESPGGAAVVVWYEPETDLVVDIHVTPSGLAEAPALFARATQAPKAGEPRTPGRLRVADQALADALRGQIGDVEIVVGDISEAREMVASLTDYMVRVQSEPEVAPETWARMFEAAAALFRDKPWDVIPPDEWIEVDCERLGIAGGALTVVGQAGESHGFLLCRSADDAVAWLSAGERRDHGEHAVFPDQFFMLSYDDQREVDPEDVAEVTRQGWAIAGPGAYPALTVLDAEANGRLPTTEEVLGVTSIIEALSSMVREEPDLGEAWDGEAVEWSGDVDGARVRLAAPLDLPPPPTDPADATLDIHGHDGLVDEVRMDRYRSALMTRLAARTEIPDDVLAAAEMLVEFAAQYHGATFGTIAVEQLEALLLETIPAQLAVEADEAARIVTAARELMRFAGEELGATAAPQALALLDPAFEQRLAGELSNPDNFGTGKQLVMAGIEAGYDMSTEDGVADFVRAFAASQQAEAPARPSRPKATAKTTGATKAKAAANRGGKVSATAQGRRKVTSTSKATPGKATSKSTPGKATSKATAGKATSKATRGKATSKTRAAKAPAKSTSRAATKAARRTRGGRTRSSR